MSVNASNMVFSVEGNTRQLTVRSGDVWDVISKPDWLSILSVNQTSSIFEWAVSFSAPANNEYDREGVVLFKSKSETIDVKVTQEGKKGKFIAVQSVSLSQKELTLTEGENAQLSYSVAPSNASIKDVTWKSSSTSVATVSSSGTVNAVSVGTSTVTVTTEDGNKTATCVVTVKPKVISVTSVSLDYSSLTITEGDSQALTATVSPSNASDKSVTWSSNNTSVATVSSTGVITGKAAGNATITVKTTDGGKTATCAVTVKAKTIAVTGVSLDKTSLSMTAGDTQTLTATITPSNATNKSVTWSTSNSSVATVSSTGVVTAKAAGTATITVKTSDGGKTATCSVTVQAKTVSVTGVSLNKSSLSMTVGDTQTLTATVSPSNATNKSVTWSSNNTSVATVSSSGLVTAIAAGSATITVKTNDGGKTAKCTVTVSDATISVTGVSLDKTSLSMTVGDTQTLTATVSPSNATNKAVTWSSNNTSVATVSSSGVVSAKAAGTATITVTTSDGGKKATCSVTVSSATVSVTGVSLNKTSLSMTVGDTQTLTATVSPSNATNKAVTWSSNNTSVATVSSSGVVTAKAVGSATISVKTNDEGKTASCLVTVSPKEQTERFLQIPYLGKVPYICEAFAHKAKWSDFSNYVLGVLNVDYSTFVKNYKLTGIYGYENIDAAGTVRLTKIADAAVGETVRLYYIDPKLNRDVDYGMVVYTRDNSTGANDAFTWTVDPMDLGQGKGKSIFFRFENGVYDIVYLEMYADVAAAAKFDFGTNKISNKWYSDIYGESLNTARMVLSPSSSSSYEVSLNSYFQGGKPSLSLSYNSDSVYKSLSGLGGNYYYYFADEQPVINGMQLCTNFWEGSDILYVGSYDNTQRVSYNGSTITVPKYNNYNTIATLDFDGVLAFNRAEDSIASALLNLWSASETDYNKMVYGNILVYTSYGNCGIPAGDAGFHVRFMLDSSSSSVSVAGVSLNKSSLSMTVGETQTLTATVSPSNATNKSITWSSSNTSVATVSSSGVVSAKAVGSAIITVKTNDGGKTATCSVTVSEVSPDAVELGLSVKWASVNLGATTPEAFGDYYAWGETETKSNYNFTTYKFGTDVTLSKYNTKSSYGTVDNKTVLDKGANGDDVASKKLGGKWRMPTDAEWTELLTECTWTWTTQNGVKGYKVTANNGNSIFLPAAGYRLDTGFVDKGLYCGYWSSSVRTDLPYGAWGIFADSGSFARGWSSRCYGFSVRPVIE